MKYLETAKWVWLRFSKVNIQRTALILSLCLNVFMAWYIIHLSELDKLNRKELTKYFNIIVDDKKEIEEEVKRLRKKVEKP